MERLSTDVWADNNIIVNLFQPDQQQHEFSAIGLTTQLVLQLPACQQVNNCSLNLQKQINNKKPSSWIKKQTLLSGPDNHWDSDWFRVVLFLRIFVNRFQWRSPMTCMLSLLACLCGVEGSQYLRESPTDKHAKPSSGLGVKSRSRKQQD